MLKSWYSTPSLLQYTSLVVLIKWYEKHKDREMWQSFNACDEYHFLSLQADHYQAHIWLIALIMALTSGWVNDVHGCELRIVFIASRMGRMRWRVGLSLGVSKFIAFSRRNTNHAVSCKARRCFINPQLISLWASWNRWHSLPYFSKYLIWSAIPIYRVGQIIWGKEKSE